MFKAKILIIFKKFMFLLIKLPLRKNNKSVFLFSFSERSHFLRTLKASHHHNVFFDKFWNSAFYVLCYIFLIELNFLL